MPKSSRLQRLATIPVVALVIMLSVEPFLFADERFTIWRVVKICSSVALLLMLWAVTRRRTADR
jgi:hypothetical protein